MNDYIGYEMELKVSPEDMDKNGIIKAEKLMLYFQQVASDHVDTLDRGFDYLMRHNWIWVMTKLQYRIEESPQLGRTYRLITCPVTKKGVTYIRDYYICDEEDREIVIATSQWCILNFETRKIERADIDFKGQYYERKAFENGIEKIRGGDLTFAETHKVTEEDLDKNQHTNNCRYAHMISEVTGEAGCRDLVIHFAKETRLGDEIKLYYQQAETGEIVVGKLPDDTIVFQAKVGS
ncbi:MAG: thioesterase [Bacillota bacterium]|nr:thioesterase [Bacillota bacterium]